ncbi:tetratricopeptide repeat protein [Methylibium sp.]|uniref:tetratricopeptide repeat protein n=1 Tax=Methylibium sp. TaxID=2067992 RepID=UPI0017B30666|nr:tetratricopeptide repeat protein [Methylibium sp.]MBA3591304.1 tetratricopeptide repeat protein [Methylibium sp.]
MSPKAQSTFTLRAAQQKLGLSRTVLAGLIDAGFVKPSRGARGEFRFSFQDLMLLRTAYALQQSGIPPRKILRSLTKLKSNLPSELPLTGLRITAVGADVAVRDRDGTLAAASGQLLMDFEVSAAGGSVAFLDHPIAASAPDAKALFTRGEALEVEDPAASEEAYRQALELAPDFEDAYLNLGALLCESHRCDAAIELYDAAIIRCPRSALIRFNRAVALEDGARLEEAIASYEQSLELDPALADAHFNIGRLQEKLGDARKALRHFSAYRRLQR